MELLNIEFLGRSLRLEGSMAGWQQLFWDNTLVSQRDATHGQQGEFVHEFQLMAGEETLNCQLKGQLTWQPFQLDYQCGVNDQLVIQGSRNEKDIEQQVPVQPRKEERRFSLIGLISLGMKALKSAKIIKVAHSPIRWWAYSQKHHIFDEQLGGARWRGTHRGCGCVSFLCVRFNAVWFSAHYGDVRDSDGMAWPTS